MKKRVFIIHGWDGSPQDGWFPWLKSELEKHNFEVYVPELPNPEEPRIDAWVKTLKNAVGVANEDTYFVGHSIGCQTIARFLETLPENIKVGGIVFVAGYFESLSNLEDDPVVKSVAKEWLETPIDLAKVKTHFKRSVAIFSDNDPYVQSSNIEAFEKIFKSKIITEHNMQHFGNETGIKELPVVLDSLLSF